MSVSISDAIDRPDAVRMHAPNRRAVIMSHQFRVRGT
jgi:hypothetical protein